MMYCLAIVSMTCKLTFPSHWDRHEEQLAGSYKDASGCKAVKGRSHSVEGRIRAQPQKSHAGRQPASTCSLAAQLFTFTFTFTSSTGGLGR